MKNQNQQNVQATQRQVPMGQSAEAPQPAPAQRPGYIDGPPTNETGEVVSAAGRSHDGASAYKTVFTSVSAGFELCEDRRFKQRVFKFEEKPDADTIASLKAYGFTYRPGEKAWTVSATPDSRRLTDELARQWAGQSSLRELKP